MKSIYLLFPAAAAAAGFLNVAAADDKTVVDRGHRDTDRLRPRRGRVTPGVRTGGHDPSLPPLPASETILVIGPSGRMKLSDGLETFSGATTFTILIDPRPIHWWLLEVSVRGHKASAAQIEALVESFSGGNAEDGANSRQRDRHPLCPSVGRCNKYPKALDSGSPDGSGNGINALGSTRSASVPSGNRTQPSLDPTGLPFQAICF